MLWACNWRREFAKGTHVVIFSLLFAFSFFVLTHRLISLLLVVESHVIPVICMPLIIASRMVSPRVIVGDATMLPRCNTLCPRTYAIAISWFCKPWFMIIHEFIGVWSDAIIASIPSVAINLSNMVSMPFVSCIGGKVISTSASNLSSVHNMDRKYVHVISGYFTRTNITIPYTPYSALRTIQHSTIIFLRPSIGWLSHIIILYSNIIISLRLKGHYDKTQRFEIPQ